MKTKKTVSGIVLSLASLLFVLGIAEFVLCIRPAVDNSYPNSSIWYRAKWYDSHRENDVKFTYAIDEYHPLYGWVLKANLANFSVNDYSVSSDKNNMRTSGELAKADSGKVKILVLGDSFTFGECVNDSETYPAFLQGMIPGSSVINAGVHGWGNDQMLLRLKNEGKNYKPSVVLLGCFNDNLLRNHLWFRDYAKPHYQLKNDSLVLKGVPVASPEQLLSGFHLKIFDFVASRLAFTDEIELSDSDKLSEKILIEIVRECRKLNAIPVFVYLPWKSECLSGRSEPSEVFTKVCTSENVLWIDPVDSIYKAISVLPDAEKEFACHYSPFINKIIAAKVKEKL